MSHYGNQSTAQHYIFKRKCRTNRNVVLINSTCKHSLKGVCPSVVGADKPAQSHKKSYQVRTVVTHRLGRKKSQIGTPLFLIFSSLSHFLVKPVTLYYAKIKSSKSKSAHIFWIGWLINEKSGCPCLRNSVLIYESPRQWHLRI